jgi:hypothetical protein
MHGAFDQFPSVDPCMPDVQQERNTGRPRSHQHPEQCSSRRRPRGRISVRVRLGGMGETPVSLRQHAPLLLGLVDAAADIHGFFTSSQAEVRGERGASAASALTHIQRSRPGDTAARSRLHARSARPSPTGRSLPAGSPTPGGTPSAPSQAWRHRQTPGLTSLAKRTRTPKLSVTRGRG